MMRKVMYVVCSTLVSLSLFCGCSRNELVKKDQPLASTPATVEKKAVPAPAKGETTAHVQKGTVTATTPATTAAAPGKEQPKAEAAVAATTAALDKIYFDFDSAALSDASRAVLSKQAEYLKKNPTIKVRIEGNCDERGSDEYNLALGEKRARSASSYLINLGIAKDRLSVISYGKEKPAVNGHDEAAWAKNRRDEFSITTR